MDELELRHYSGLEIRIAADSKKLVGYAATFGKDTDIGYFTESIAPGAFTRTLRERPDVRALFDHDTGRIIARAQGGSLAVKEDSVGLYVEIDPVNTSDGNDVRELVTSGVVDGMSFGFYPMITEWSTRGDKEHRTLIDVELVEVSIVTFPAYEGTSIHARSVQRTWEEHVHKDKNEKPSHFRDMIKRKIALFERIVSF